MEPPNTKGSTSEAILFYINAGVVMILLGIMSIPDAEVKEIRIQTVVLPFIKSKT